MARNRVRIAGARNQTVPIPEGGAILGVNLYNPDGTLVDLAAMIAAAIGGATSTGSSTGSDGGISLDDVQADGDGTIAVAGSLAQGYLDVGLDLARSWVFA